jgi:branched-chain amino acid transport system substrate-binding protein
VNYINADLGGVDGHPLKLVTCFITSAEEEGTTCGQQFAADKSIDVIGEGGVAIGIQPFYSAIGKKTPVIVGVAATPTDGVQPNAVILFGDATHVLGPFGSYAKNVLHASTAALVYPDIAGITQGAAAIEAGLKAAGVTVKSVGYDPSQTDLTGVLTASGALSADMVIPYADSADCVNLAKSMIQLGITDARKIVSAPLCLNGQVAAGLGGDSRSGRTRSPAPCTATRPTRACRCTSRSPSSSAPRPMRPTRGTSSRSRRSSASTGS